MRSKRSRLGVLAGIGFAVCAIMLPAGAHGAKVTATAAGGPVPNATGGMGLAVSVGSFTQTFELKGKKVKKQQIRDVNLTMTSTGNTGDVNDDLFATLYGPGGDNADVPLPDFGTSFVGLKFDDQSDRSYCNPFQFVAPFCNYVIGATQTSTDFGSFTGTIDAGLYANNTAAGFNPVFKGGNPNGTWRLTVYDASTNNGATFGIQTATLGTSTLEVTTGKKFAKE